MSAKFKIGLTVSAETLFTLLSKLLPIENLSVEEVAERQPPLPMEAIAQAIKPITKPIRAPQVRAKRGSGYTLNPNAGVNKIMLDLLADGKPHHAVEADGALKEAGYSINGVYGRMQHLKRHGYVIQPSKGLWQLSPERDEREQEKKAP